ncbi:DNA polymerase III subunit gamma and tau [Microbacterium sp. SSW1-59]|uniref:DNA polymerase III subunit gamma and tau n=1 Tax=Microbacterium xanthum TaxID=3079794 RepID=UPI002AD34D86|nr:DNA polymerase III subunit gamma and tau [Microbacterium sp. SSW1-59]MDZ8200030.1 DNA polymerase III subunit gamma and tau [Microbacterium sp. SSW1-59]
MTTALYRRYRPEAFGEMIGQSQVTEPLMTALRGDRVGHAYLFSGPRGCGKTTSARILARCLNCAEGPTDTPCGSCESCVELGRGGGGSLDVVEIDAASHNGVDDARDLRERAVFAPARDRFKIFILDEAHMVTPQGFNALLKLVEEPPDHVKFIFATTEPEKVIGTIRSRTHHYPFRLVPPAAMLSYVEELCASEGVRVETGVLPLVVRAGGGSPRDTLSLLDQLIAGSDVADGGVLVRYERAVALLGYTHGELLDDVVHALGARDAAAAFGAVDRVVQTGQDPRRFVDDLLERLRDLIIIAATGEGAAAVLRGVSDEELQNYTRQAEAFGASRLSRTADVVIAALDEMTGATSPRLQLELMVARVLTAADGPVPAPAEGPVAPAAAAPVPSAAPVAAPKAEESQGASTASPVDMHSDPASGPEPEPEPEPSPPSGPLTTELVREHWDAVLARLEGISRSSWLIVLGARVAEFTGDVLTLAFTSNADIAKFKQRTAGAGPSEDLRQAIVAVLGVRVKYLANLDDDGSGPGGGPGGPAPSPPAPGPTATPAGRSPHGSPRSEAGTAPAAAAPVTDWAVAPIPRDVPSAPREGPAVGSSPGASLGQFAVDDDPEDARAAVRTETLAPAREGDVLPREDTAPTPDDDRDEDPELDTDVRASDAPVPPVVAPRLSAPEPRAASRPSGRDGVQRYGEAVVRQVLGATFVREEPYEAPTRFS